MHFVDEGPKNAAVMLLVHGMPTWSYLYRDMIPGLIAAGYRCIAPDHLGFGRSDKPTDPHWYTIARHTEVLTSVVTGLGLTDVTLVCQDWGGPIGIAQAVTMPERFSRIVIMNIWLHHQGYEYSDAIRAWNQNWHQGGLFDRELPASSWGQPGRVRHHPTGATPASLRRRAASTISETPARSRTPS